MNQVWNPVQYGSKGSFVPTLGEPLLTLLEPQPGMKILDLGCGNGTLTRKIMDSGAEVIGIDASQSMVDAAREKGLSAIRMNAYEMTFDQEFDAVFSNAALHWMAEDPKKVVQNVARALKPQGRFIAEMGGEGNIHHIQEAERQALKRRNLDLDQIAPKFFPSAETYQSMLEAAGFNVEMIRKFDRLTRLPEDGVKGWLSVFSTAVLNALPEQDREPFLQEVEDLTRPHLLDEQGWFADYVRLRFVASKI